ncbi:hypothetical protein L1987_44022 [Smallanthus sonchifolius]|uniref:Uncharacterized protein n=1 Tax=Smallanthus sonchifolius TaxID=185202 RepID=A0ACB9GMQ7_9ASTR|nr:hypothetical protein L1987_44022 [Smallanthus sonchifolius]
MSMLSRTLSPGDNMLSSSQKSIKQSQENEQVRTARSYLRMKSQKFPRQQLADKVYPLQIAKSAEMKNLSRGIAVR